MSTMETQNAETEIVQGTVVGIIQKGIDKWQVAVQTANSTFSRKLWTKDAVLIDNLSRLIGSEQSFLCGISHWQRQDGQAVRSLWVNGVGPGVVAPAQPVQPVPAGQAGGAQGGFAPSGPMQTVGEVMQQMGAVPVQPTYTQPVSAATSTATVAKDPTEVKIHRQTASKVAVQLLGHLPPDVPRDFLTLIALCERLVAYYDHGIKAPPEPPQQQHASSYYDDLEPDDSIPF